MYFPFGFSILQLSPSHFPAILQWKNLQQRLQCILRSFELKLKYSLHPQRYGSSGSKLTISG